MTKNAFLAKSFLSSEKKQEDEPEREVTERPVEFETAVSALGFGKFNIILIVILIPSIWAHMFDTNLMSYVSPIAKCDLDLSLNEKGTLNGISSFGAIAGGLFWGILLDTVGRKKMIIYGYLVQGIITVITSLSQNYPFLLITKFISGIMSGGLYIALSTYYAEFHSTKYRSKIQMSIGFACSAALVIIPFVSSLFLPLDIHMTFFNESLIFHSWNLLVLVTSTLSFISGIIFIFLPESPKYLMSNGRNEEALTVFRKVYRINKNQPENCFPIRILINEHAETKEDTRKASVINYIRNGWRQVSSLFNKHYFPKLVLISSVQFLTITNMNALRLWLPQIFQSIHEYQVDHNGTTAQICTMLESLRTVNNMTDAAASECSVNNENNMSVYLNTMVNAPVCMIGFVVSGALINIIGRKRLLCAFCAISAITILTTYWSRNTITTLALTSLQLAASGVCFDIIITMIVVIFPTTLRATAMSTALMVGRSGAVVGSMIFPVLLQLGCPTLFFSLGGVSFVATFLCLLLPVADDESLK